MLHVTGTLFSENFRVFGTILLIMKLFYTFQNIKICFVDDQSVLNRFASSDKSSGNSSGQKFRTKVRKKEKVQKKVRTKFGENFGNSFSEISWGKSTPALVKKL